MAYYGYELNKNIFIEDKLSSSEYDGVIYILYPGKRVEWPRTINGILEKLTKLDANIHKNTTLIPCDYVSGDRLIISGTGEITRYHSVKVVKEAAKKGMKKAIDCGMKSPMLIVQKFPDFEEAPFVSILGALEALYTPLQIRELKNDVGFTKIGIYAEKEVHTIVSLVKTAIGIENSRIVVRDIAGGDPERMAPSKVVDYVKDVLKDDPNITIDIVEDEKIIAAEYPLLAAVSRADNLVERHKPRILRIEYKSPNAINKTIGLVGKGVTYDTGGANIKTEDYMTGMSRDKTGAATVAGFLKACSIFKPDLAVVGILCLCRNSVGADSYVADELLVSRSGKLVRVTNTDAEGRFAMADALHALTTSFEKINDSQIYTIATLTGHARRSYGNNTAAVDNCYLSSLEKSAYELQKWSKRFGEGIEVSLLQNEDFEANRGECKGDDMVQISSSVKVRGHQIAAAFLVSMGGLDERRVAFTHLDIAGSGGSLPEQPTAEPLISLCYLHDIFQSFS